MDGTGLSFGVFGTRCSLGFCCRKVNTVVLQVSYVSIGDNSLVEHRTILKLMPATLAWEEN